MPCCRVGEKGGIGGGRRSRSRPGEGVTHGAHPVGGIKYRSTPLARHGRLVRWVTYSDHHRRLLWWVAAAGTRPPLARAWAGAVE